MTLSVVVPTYRRPARLAAALAALRAQRVPVDEVIVVRRADDADTARVIAEYVDVSEVLVHEPGVLTAMVAGARAASGDLIGFIDDDAEPGADWSEAVIEELADPSVGAVGVRDVVTDPDDLPRALEVGTVTRWGKVIGNHHVAVGDPRDVEILKAVNMVFRREALALPLNLRGSGAQVHFEVATCLRAREQGWRLRFDPSRTVLHLPGPRFDADRRGRPAPQAVRDAAYNLVVCLLSQRRDLMWRRALYGLAVGDRGAPGLVRGIWAIFVRDWSVARKLVPSLVGQAEGLAAVVRESPITFEVFESSGSVRPEQQLGQ